MWDSRWLHFMILVTVAAIPRVLNHFFNRSRISQPEYKFAAKEHRERESGDVHSQVQAISNSFANFVPIRGCYQTSVLMKTKSNICLPSAFKS